uniref:hypothetical protein n=1 Tax=Pseudonocardia sp. CA-138482 TaxID=3240023 RepID=UPI003F493914
MSDVRRYVLVDSKDREVGSTEYDQYREAVSAAERHEGVAVVEYVYEFADSELVWTPDGSTIWPLRTTPGGAR